MSQVSHPEKINNTGKQGSGPLTAVLDDNGHSDGDLSQHQDGDHGVNENDRGNNNQQLQFFTSTPRTMGFNDNSEDRNARRYRPENRPLELVNDPSKFDWKFATKGTFIDLCKGLTQFLHQRRSRLTSKTKFYADFVKSPFCPPALQGVKPIQIKNKVNYVYRDYLKQKKNGLKPFKEGTYHELEAGYNLFCLLEEAKRIKARGKNAVLNRLDDRDGSDDNGDLDHEPTEDNQDDMNSDIEMQMPHGPPSSSMHSDQRQSSVPAQNAYPPINNGPPQNIGNNSLNTPVNNTLPSQSNQMNVTHRSQRSSYSPYTQTTHPNVPAPVSHNSNMSYSQNVQMHQQQQDYPRHVSNEGTRQLSNENTRPASRPSSGSTAFSSNAAVPPEIQNQIAKTITTVSESLSELTKQKIKDSSYDARIERLESKVDKLMDDFGEVKRMVSMLGQHLGAFR